MFLIWVWELEEEKQATRLTRLVWSLKIISTSEVKSAYAILAH